MDDISEEFFHEKDSLLKEINDLQKEIGSYTE